MLKILKRNIKRLKIDITIINYKMKKENKVRQYRSNQGRSPEQQQSNEKAMFVSCMGLLVMLLGIILYGLLTNG